MSASWGIALGYALTGAELDSVNDPDRPDAAAVAGFLDRSGWSRDRVLAHARAEVEAERPWPHAVPADLRPAAGAAQFHAALGALRAELNLTALESRPPSTRTKLTADEQRLLREVPPHHGS